MRPVRRRGFTLIEVLAALLLYIAVLSVSSVILATSIKAIGDSSRQMAQARSLDTAIAELRKDAWASAEMTQVDATTLELRAPGGPRITWAIMPNLTLRRSEAVAGRASIIRNFAAIPANLTLGTRDKMVLLQATDSSGRGATVCLPSQFLLAGGQP